MSIKDKYSVRAIQKYECKEWLLEKHYARRMPSISYAFGLYGDRCLLGVATFGKPASPYICMGICGKSFSDFVYELNRLCVAEALEKNVLSFFLGSALKLIQETLIIVSYADTALGHHGYIYQATNWIYTGATKERTDIGVDDGSHSRHYDKGLDTTLNRKFRSSKFRYVVFIGRRRKEFRRALVYPVLPYPKGDNKRHDASYEPTTQALLF